jgi:NifU-like protein involved in Fe-S cluster formation
MFRMAGFVHHPVGSALSEARTNYHSFEVITMAYSEKVVDHYENPATSAPSTGRRHRGHRHGRRAGLRRCDETADQVKPTTGVIEDAR